MPAPDVSEYLSIQPLAMTVPPLMVMLPQELKQPLPVLSSSCEVFLLCQSHRLAQQLEKLFLVQFHHILLLII